MSEQDVCLRPPVGHGDDRHSVLALNGDANPQNVLPMELHVFLRGATLPTREEWQAGITDHGFLLTLDEALDVRNHTGFSRAVCWGRKSGFEFDLHPAVDVTPRYPGVAARVGTRDLSANFRWRGSVLESVIVYVASAVFAKLTDGLLYYPQRNHFATGYETMAMAKRLVELAELD